MPTNDAIPGVGQNLSYMSGILEDMSDSRLLTLLSLLQTPREWPGGELADRLGVSRRTVRRDVERLRDLGYPVEATMGAAGGYRLVAGAAMPPLLLDDEEAVAITVGLSTAARHPVQGIEEASVRALAKLEQVLPARLRYRVRALSGATVPMPAVEGPQVDPGRLTALAAAVANKERVRFAYRTNDGTTTRRLVDPHRMVAAGRRWYLLGHDHDRDDWRIFRIDRIDDVRATGARVVPREPPAGDAAAYVADQLYSLAATYEAVVTLRAPVTEVVRALGEVTPIGERACRVRMHADTLDWLAFRLTTLGCEFEVHEPPELTAHLRALAARLTRAAG
ncbi:Predicted DNA-binding transcriptional regulator YafY, contains an HTH and WYL domains [Nonomuraea solani]|uniref:Predicted DNA-binding transcriptional regulator YafY, contains an HTH and WYL domains n=2 Tax=Nonomuraea solani TaxID=1144553 RepID=A0A1H6EMV1_9ACTN|nr:Predicted DNA-binding transcriptional regulator YafY, contains an HTH and WYL domains [Nonomuraea solani]